MFKLILLICGAVLHADEPGYDESHDESGQARPAYAEFLKHYRVNVLRPRAAVTDTMLDYPLSDSNKALPVPLVLAREEYLGLRDAVAERAEVYRELFHDLVNEQRIFAARDPRFRATIEAAFRREDTSLEFLKRIYGGKPRSQIRFLYAPDLMRGPDGRWLVIEDNIGGLPGGFADLDPLRERFTHVSGIRIPSSSLTEDVLEAFQDLTQLTRQQIQIAVHLPSVEYMEERDDEGRRIVDVAKASGLSFTVVADQGTVDLAPGRTRRALINWIDVRQHMSAVEYLKMAGDVAGGTLELFESLGVHALSDKTLLPYVDDLAKFYFGETLQLRSPPSTPVGSRAKLRRVVDQFGQDVVVKSARGAGGSEVFFWKTMDNHQRMRLIRHIEEASAQNELQIGVAAADYVMQPAVSPSHLPVGSLRRGPRATIDLRPITYVGPGPVQTPSYFWGRATTRFGNRRTNVSQGAMQLVVLPSCAAWLTEY